MKVLNKIAMGASFGALAIALAGGVDASAEDGLSVTITSKKEMKVTGGQSEVYVSFDAFKSKDGAWNPKAKWDVYAAASASSMGIDLSQVKTTKDSYITVKSGETIQAYKITKDTTKYKGKVKAGELELDGVEKGGVCLYRTEAGDITSYTVPENDIFVNQIKKYEQQGATLYFRSAGANGNITIDTSKKEEKEAGDVKCPVYTIEGSQFASKEFKVKVPKAANQPAIPVDYTKGIFKKKPKLEYRTATDVSSFYGVSAPTWAPLSDDVAVSTAAGIAQMRTAATEKKSASKIAVFTWKDFAVTQAQDIKVESGKATIAQTGESKLTIESIPVPKTDDKATMTLKADGADYLIYKTEPKDATAKADVTIKNGQTKTVKISAIGKETKCWVRTAGEKANKKKNNNIAKFPSVPAQASALPFATATPKPTEAPKTE